MLGGSSGGENHSRFLDNQVILKVSLIPVHAHEYHQLCYTSASVEFINGYKIFFGIESRRKLSFHHIERFS
jgi:hypothetical protein